ncbi:MAG: hypothetical protein ACSHWY_06495 [Octadecabacter sp.]
MSKLANLIIKTVARNITHDPTQQRRRKLLDALNVQSKVLAAALKGEAYQVAEPHQIYHRLSLKIDSSRQSKPTRLCRPTDKADVHTLRSESRQRAISDRCCVVHECPVW